MSTRKCRTCLLCPRKAAPGCWTCDECSRKSIKARISAIRSAFRGAKLRAEREQERR